MELLDKQERQLDRLVIKIQEGIMGQYKKMFYESIVKELEGLIFNYNKKHEDLLKAQEGLIERLKTGYKEEVVKVMENIYNTYKTWHNLLVHAINKINLYFQHIKDSILCLQTITKENNQSQQAAQNYETLLENKMTNIDDNISSV